MALPSFKVGSKELFVPNIMVTLMRNGYGPQFAKFRVPLFFSKLDLRDYLWHAYKVEIVAVRSYIKQQRVRAENVGGRPAPRRWHRPRAHKHMTVQLVRPFVWPEEPESYKEWDMENMKASVEEGKEQQKIMGSDKDTIVNEERREKMREQAKLLLEGKARWKPGKLGTPATLVARNR